MFKINKKNSFNMTLLLLSLWSKTLRSYSETMNYTDVIHRLTATGWRTSCDIKCVTSSYVRDNTITGTLFTVAMIYEHILWSK